MDCLVGLEVDSDDEYGPGFGFPKKGLVPTSFDVVVLQLSDPVVVGVQDEDASMITIIGTVGVGW